jgi:hypothetical protein
MGHDRYDLTHSSAEHTKRKATKRMLNDEDEHAEKETHEDDAENGKCARPKDESWRVSTCTQNHSQH